MIKVEDTLVLVLLQATIGKKHGDFKKEVLSSKPSILNKAKKADMEIRFLFLVPFKGNFSLTKEQKKKANPASIEVVELNPCNSYL